MKLLFGMLILISGCLFPTSQPAGNLLPVSQSTIPSVESTPSPSATTIYLPTLISRPPLRKPVLKWQQGGCYSGWCQAGYFSSPSVADINGDGRAEVIAGASDVVALDGETGALKWRAKNDGRVWSGTVVTDLTGDGKLEIIAGFYNDQLTVYDASGNPLWTRNPFTFNPETCGVDEIRSVAVADLDNDGQGEILVGRAGCGGDRQVNVYEPNGLIRPGWPARRSDDTGHGWGMYNQNISVADINEDGFKEVIGTSDTLYITGLDKDGNQLPTSSIFYNTSPAGPKVWSTVGVFVDPTIELRGYGCNADNYVGFSESPPVLADVNGDGKREVIAVGNVGNCSEPRTDKYFIPFIFNADRTRWKGSGFDWSTIPIPDANSGPVIPDYISIRHSRPDPVVVDLDGDGFKEILYPSFDGRVHAYWLDKTEHGSWPFQVNNPADGFISFASEPAVADLNNDGKAEVIVASWAQEGSNHNGKLYILNYLGQKLFEVDLPPAVRDTWNGASAAPTLANIDADPDLEVLLQTAHSGVVAYDLPGSAGARILWQTGRGDFLRSGSK